MVVKDASQFFDYWNYNPQPGAENYSIRLELRKARNAFFIHQLCLEKLEEYLPGQELDPDDLYRAGAEVPTSLNQIKYSFECLSFPTPSLFRIFAY